MAYTDIDAAADAADAFELSGKTANRKAVLAKHDEIKEIVAGHDIAIEFSKLMTELVTKYPGHNGRALILGAIIELGFNLMVTASVVVGVDQTDEAIDSLVDGILTYGKNTLKNSVHSANAITEEQIKSFIENLKNSEPETVEKLARH